MLNFRFFRSREEFWKILISGGLRELFIIGMNISLIGFMYGELCIILSVL